MVASSKLEILDRVCAKAGATLVINEKTGGLLLQTENVQKTTNFLYEIFPEPEEECGGKKEVPYNWPA